MERLCIDARFCGPPGTGNGGYVGGRLAAHVSGTAEVTLRAPVPLDRCIEIIPHPEGGVALRDAGQLLATARPTTLELDVPDPPPYETAERVAGSCRAFQTHPFPGCFVCGPERPVHDGLRVFPGGLPGRGIVAAPWVPDPSLADATGRVAAAFLWAALDCTSAFPLLEDEAARALEPMVLGRLAVAIEAELLATERAVVIAWPIALEGRRGHAGSALFRESGERVASARATWVSLARS